MPDATSLHHCLKNKQLNETILAVTVQQNEYLINYARLVGLWLILAYD